MWRERDLFGPRGRERVERRPRVLQLGRSSSSVMRAAARNQLGIGLMIVGAGIFGVALILIATVVAILLGLVAWAVLMGVGVWVLKSGGPSADSPEQGKVRGAARKVRALVESQKDADRGFGAELRSSTPLAAGEVYLAKMDAFLDDRKRGWLVLTSQRLLLVRREGAAGGLVEGHLTKGPPEWEMKLEDATEPRRIPHKASDVHSPNLSVGSGLLSVWNPMGIQEFAEEIMAAREARGR